MEFNELAQSLEWPSGVNECNNEIATITRATYSFTSLRTILDETRRARSPDEFCCTLSLPPGIFAMVKFMMVVVQHASLCTPLSQTRYQQDMLYLGIVIVGEPYIYKHIHEDAYRYTDKDKSQERERERAISIAQDRLSAIEDEGLTAILLDARGAPGTGRRSNNRGSARAPRRRASNNQGALMVCPVVGEPAISGYRACALVWLLGLYYWPLQLLLIYAPDQQANFNVPIQRPNNAPSPRFRLQNGAWLSCTFWSFLSHRPSRII